MAATRRRKNSARAQGGALTRREFARSAAAAAAAIAALPASPLYCATGAAAEIDPPQSTPSAAAPPLPQDTPSQHPKLSAEALAEAEAKTTEILRRYGAKLTDEQKAEVRRLVQLAQAPIETLRRFPLENSDEPATILRFASASAARRAPVARPAATPKPPGKGS